MPERSLLPIPAAVVAPGDDCRTGLTVIAFALVALTKPRLGFFSVLTAMAAYVATGASAGAWHALATLAGTAVSAGGALSLNQWWERDVDARMKRTRDRPLPGGRVTPASALTWSLFLSLGGVGLLAWRVNVTAAAIAAATILIYVLVYTPMKRRTRWATEVGALSGALPPLLGAAAAGNVASSSGWVLAGVLLFWQMPHFYAIGWMYRDDYLAAGFPLLPAVDPTGVRTSAWGLGYTLVLVAVSLVPWILGSLSVIFGASALLGGGAFLWRAWKFATADGDRNRAARQLFVASLLYLPLVLGALLIDRL